MAAPGKWKAYRSFKRFLFAGGGVGIDPAATPLKCGLYLSTSNANDLTQSVLANLTNEHANANGYLTGGVALTGITWTQLLSVWTLDFNDPAWTPAGGNIVCRFAAIYVDATLNAVVKPLIAVSLLDTTPADVTGFVGNPFELRIAAGGALTLDGAEVD